MPDNSNCIALYQFQTKNQIHTFSGSKSPPSRSSSLETCVSEDNFLCSRLRLFKSDLYSRNFVSNIAFCVGCKLRASKSILLILKTKQTKPKVLQILLRKGCPWKLVRVSLEPHTDNWIELKFKQIIHVPMIQLHLNQSSAQQDFVSFALLIRL